MKTRTRQSEAFTLTELLVVIAVLGVLVCLRLPAFGLTRQKSKQVACWNNCKQMALASRMYSDDNREKAFAYERNAGDDNMNFLYPNHVQDLKVFVCPATKNAVLAGNSSDWIVADWPPGATNLWLKDLRNNTSSTGAARGHSYEVRGWYAPLGGVTFKKTQRSVLTWSVTSDHGFSYLTGTKPGPANTFIIHDQDEVNSPPRRYYKYPDEEDNHGRTGNNVAFCDGHAEFIKENKWVYRFALSEDSRPTCPPWASPPVVGY